MDGAALSPARAPPPHPPPRQLRGWQAAQTVGRRRPSDRSTQRGQTKAETSGWGP